MKIVYLHQYFLTPKEAGGTRSYEMARRFVAAGHEVHLVTARSDADAPLGWNDSEIEGIHVHWLNLSYENKMSFRRRLVAFTTFALRSAVVARSLRGDVILASSTPLTIAVPALFAIAWRQTPLVFEVRDLWPEMPIAMGALKNPLLIKVARVLEHLAYSKSHAVVALSEGMRQGVEKTGAARRVVVAPNSCDIETFSVPDSAGRAFKADRPWLGDGPLIVYAGKLGHINGIDYLVRLAQEYRHLDPRSRFLIIGDGAQREAVRRLASGVGVLGENLFMEPPIAKSEIPAALNAADVCCSFFVPIKEMWANSANKFFDALAAGRPVVVNYGGWQAQLIARERIGVVLDAHSPTRAAQALRTFLESEDRREEAARNAKALAVNEFSRDRIAHVVLGVLLDAFHSDGSRSDTSLAATRGAG